MFKNYDQCEQFLVDCSIRIILHNHLSFYTCIIITNQSSIYLYISSLLSHLLPCFVCTWFNMLVLSYQIPYIVLSKLYAHVSILPIADCTVVMVHRWIN